MQGLCMPIFRPLASLVLEENDVTYGRTLDVMPNPNCYTKFLTPPSLLSVGKIKKQKKFSYFKNNF